MRCAFSTLEHISVSLELFITLLVWNYSLETKILCLRNKIVMATSTTTTTRTSVTVTRPSGQSGYFKTVPGILRINEIVMFWLKHFLQNCENFCNLAIVYDYFYMQRCYSLQPFFTVRMGRICQFCFHDRSDRIHDAVILRDYGCLPPV